MQDNVPSLQSLIMGLTLAAIILSILGYWFPKMEKKEAERLDAEWKEQNPPIDFLQDISNCERPYLSEEQREIIYHNNQN